MKSSAEEPLAKEISELETELADERQKSASLEALVASLMGEMISSEERRARERRLSRDHGSLVPREAVENAREILEEGSNALMAAHEHTLRLVEMRIAAMGAQLARCAAALPQPPNSEVVVDDGQLSPHSPEPPPTSPAATRRWWRRRRIGRRPTLVDSASIRYLCTCHRRGRTAARSA